MAVRIGSFIAEAFGIGCSAGADTVGNDDMMRLNFIGFPFL